MDLRAFVRTVRLHGWHVALLTLAAVAVSLVITLVQVPMYASTAHLFVAAGDSKAQGSQGEFVAQRLQSYVRVFDGDAVARRVIKQLNLNETPSELSDQIEASADAKTVVLSIRVEDPSADRAQLLADAVATEFIAFLGDLEASTPGSESAAPIKATLVDAPDVPREPSSPNLPLNLGIGLVVGLLLGLVSALLREHADTTIRTASVLEDATDAPLLGAILFDEHAFDEPTIRHLDHYDPRVEGYRILRTSLEFLSPGHADGAAESKVYVVTSAVPGEGKTTTAINVGLILAEGGERVALVEADLRRPTMSEYLDLDPKIGLTTTLIGRTTLSEAVQEVGALDVLTSGRRPPNPAELVKSQAMRTLIAALRKQYTYVLIDAPPLLPVTDASLLAAWSDGVILVTRYGDTKEAEVGSAVTRLKSVNSSVVGSILNMAPANDADGHGYGYGYAPDEDGTAEPRAKRPEPRHDEPREKPAKESRKPKREKIPKRAPVVVEEVPYASLLARLESAAAPPEADPVEPAVAETLDGTPPAAEGDAVGSGQSLLDQINAAMSMAQTPVPSTEPAPAVTAPVAADSTPPADPARTGDVIPWWGFGSRTAEPELEAGEPGTEPDAEPKPPSDEPEAGEPEPEPEPESDDEQQPPSDESAAEADAEPQPPSDESEPEPDPVVETTGPNPEHDRTPEPTRPTVWPASWAVQTAGSFVESEDAETGPDETTHQFPGLAPARSVAESAEPDPEDDLVAEADPVIEPPAATD